jgi:hypothetical protein
MKTKAPPKAQSNAPFRLKPPGGPLQDLPVESLVLDPHIQPREGLDDEAVKDYGADLKAGKVYPLIDVVFDGKRYIVWHGFHRSTGARLAGLKTIKANVSDGTWEEAQWWALATNKTNKAVRRKPCDTELAIRRALTTRPQTPDGQIAAHIGVARTTVLNHRRALEATCQLDKSTSRTGKDGRTINTSKIGKAKPAPSTGEGPQSANAGTKAKPAPAPVAPQTAEHTTKPPAQPKPPAAPASATPVEDGLGEPQPSAPAPVPTIRDWKRLAYLGGSCNEIGAQMKRLATRKVAERDPEVVLKLADRLRSLADRVEEEVLE